MVIVQHIDSYDDDDYYYYRGCQYFASAVRAVGCNSVTDMQRVRQCGEYCSYSRCIC